MKLHVGCGSIYRKGYVNIDAFDDSVADCIADALRLPFPDRSSERVESYQLIEHLGFFGAFYHLAECHRVLRPGGVLVLETPDPAASFRKFLACKSRDDRAETLGWIFGHGDDGHAHRFLFPEDALREIFTRSGFADPVFEEPRTHLYAPGLRVVSAKNGDGVYSVLSRLRRSLAPGGVADLPDQVELIEFERRFIGSTLALAGRDGKRPDDDPRSRFVEMVVFSPSLALEYLDAVAAGDVRPIADFARFRPHLERLVSSGFTAMLHAAFDRLSETPNAVTDGYDHVFEAGEALVRKLLAEPHPPADASLADAFDRPLGATDAFRTDRLFSRHRVTARARRWRDLGIKHLCRDEPAEAETFLTRSINSKVEYFYSVWNLAIVRARAGELDAAAEYYRLALRFEVPGTEEVLGRELETVLRHAGRSTGGSEPLPPIRTEPVLVGDHAYARP